MNTKEQAALDELLSLAVKMVGYETALKWADDPRKVEMIKSLAMMNARDGISIK